MREVTLSSLKELLTAAIEDAGGDAYIASSRVLGSLYDDFGFGEEVATVLFPYAIQCLAEEIVTEDNPNRFVLPSGTRW